MKAFQTALVHDLDGGAGFADMYAQTIAYGLLSARIADPARRTADDFAALMRTNPFIRELMETFLRVGGRRGKAGGPGIDFDELGVSEVVELLDQANIEAVVRDFGDRNPQEDPVIHFYEHFLAAYDKKQKVRRGVFYTPRPVVSYIVRSVDKLLRIEFGLTDGLADSTDWGEMAKRHEELKIPEGNSPTQAFVQILDPATGTFLVEVIDLIHKLRAADGPIRHRAPQDRAQAFRDRLPLRKRRAGTGVPHECAGAGGGRAAHARLLARPGARGHGGQRDQAKAAVHSGDRESALFRRFFEHDVSATPISGANGSRSTAGYGSTALPTPNGCGWNQARRSICSSPSMTQERAPTTAGVQSRADGRQRDRNRHGARWLRHRPRTECPAGSHQNVS